MPRAPDDIMKEHGDNQPVVKVSRRWYQKFWGFQWFAVASKLGLVYDKQIGIEIYRKILSFDCSSSTRNYSFVWKLVCVCYCIWSVVVNWFCSTSISFYYILKLYNGFSRSTLCASMSHADLEFRYFSKFRVTFF